MDTAPTPEAVGKRLAELRKRMKPKPTQADIGDTLTVHWRTVQNWERGLSIPWEHLAQLAEIYNTSIRWILWGDEYTDEIEQAVLRGVEEALRRSKN